MMTKSDEILIGFLADHHGLSIIQVVAHGVMGLFLEQFLLFLQKEGYLKEDIF